MALDEKIRSDHEAAQKRIKQALSDSHRIALQQFGDTKPDPFNSGLIDFLAHEIKNVFAQLRAATNVIEQSPDDPAIVRECVAVLYDALQRGEVDLNLLRAPSNTIVRKPNQRIALTPIVYKVVDCYRRPLESAGHRIAVVPVADKEQLHVRDFVIGNERDLFSVLHNLVKNSYEALPPKNGTILLGTNPVSLTQAIRAAVDETIPPGDYMRLDISDTGTGIPKENQNRVFNPYFTTKPEGDGIGLTAVYQIVKRHDGYICVLSEIGKGTTFAIYIPQAATKL